MFKRIAVGYDGSTCADQAVHAALNLTSGPGSHLSVVSVIPPARGETDEDRVAAFERDAEGIRESARAHRGAAEAQGVAYHVEVLAGSRPADALISIVADRGFDLLVVGRHGRERAGHAGLGWVAHQLVADAACPVLVAGDGHLTAPV